MNKNLLFYSNGCRYSRELIKKINEHRICPDLMRVCIDSGKVRLPSFVTVVPTIYLSLQKQILTEDRLENWIDERIKKSVPEKLTSYCTSNSAFTNCYALLDESKQIPNNNFSDYSSPDSQMNTPAMFEDKKGVNSAYEKLLFERSNDFQGIKRV